MYDLLLKNGFVYLNGRFVKKNIGVTDGKIAYIGNEEVKAEKVVDVYQRKVLPGLIDPHVHFDLFCGTIPSRDDFYYGSKSAAYGGITTIVDFLDPSRNAKELKESYYERLKKAEKCNVDYHFHACIREPNGNLEEYILMMKTLGINTIKLFTTYSETHRRTYDRDIKKLLALSRKYRFLVLAHIENDEMINRDESLTYQDLAEARPSEAETSEALKLCKFAKQTKGYLYMVHCSSGNTLQKICEKYYNILGKNIFIESCPQYFVFNKDKLKGKQGYLYTFAPPLRSEEERKLLIKNIEHVNTIGTDHCAFNIEDKETHTYLKGMPLGVGGIESSFQIMYEMFGDQIINKMSKNIAKIERFAGKGEIKVGNFADFVILSGATHEVGKPHGAVDYSIYEHIKVNTTIESTMIRGEFVLYKGKFIPHKGQIINCGKGVSK